MGSTKWSLTQTTWRVGSFSHPNDWEEVRCTEEGGFVPSSEKVKVSIYRPGHKHGAWHSRISSVPTIGTCTDRWTGDVTECLGPQFWEPGAEDLALSLRIPGLLPQGQNKNDSGGEVWNRAGPEPSQGRETLWAQLQNHLHLDVTVHWPREPETQKQIGKTVCLVVGGGSRCLV